jgi:hypothetical protein
MQKTCERGAKRARKIRKGVKNAPKRRNLSKKKVQEALDFTKIEELKIMK